MDKTSSTAQSHHVLIDVKETADYLGCTVSTLYSWVSQKKIPYVKIGRLVKFDQCDIDAWIEERKVKPYSY